MPMSNNRTKWPIKGGAVSFQPGWFAGHKTAFIYINMGYGTIPPNMSHPMIAPFQIVSPTNEEYPGTFCLPQIPLPLNANLKVGDDATIQLVEIAQHGAALYNVNFSRPLSLSLPISLSLCAMLQNKPHFVSLLVFPALTKIHLCSASISP